MQKHNEDTIKTSGHSSFEKNIPHILLKGLCVRRSWRPNKDCYILTPNPSTYHSLSFPFFWAPQPGAWRPSLCWNMVLIPASSLQLTWTTGRRSYIIIWHPPTSCKRHNSHSIQTLDSQGRLLISSNGCTCYLHRCISYFDSSAESEVNMQQLKSALILSTVDIKRPVARQISK